MEIPENFGVNDQPFINFPCEHCGADFVFRPVSTEVQEVRWTCYECGTPRTINKEQIKPHHLIS